MKALVAFLLVIATVPVAVLPQESRSAFEVASVKPNDSGSRASQTEFPPGGRFVSTNSSLRLLIRIAYSLPDYQVLSGEDWTRSAKFDVDAKSGNNASRNEIRAMLQTLLQERFKLQVHRETKQDSVYELVTAKGGPKFAPSSSKIGDPHDVTADRGVITSKGGELSQFIWFLTQILDRQVVDKTNLNGYFDFQFVQPRTALPTPDSQGPTMFDELQEQLGLRLEPGKGPVEFLVIDHAERATPN